MSIERGIREEKKEKIREYMVEERYRKEKKRKEEWKIN
jgi:hypothetical protein